MLPMKNPISYKPATRVSNCSGLKNCDMTSEYAVPRDLSALKDQATRNLRRRAALLNRAHMRATGMTVYWLPQWKAKGHIRLESLRTRRQ